MIGDFDLGSGDMMIVFCLTFKYFMSLRKKTLMYFCLDKQLIQLLSKDGPNTSFKLTSTVRSYMTIQWLDVRPVM